MFKNETKSEPEQTTNTVAVALVRSPEKCGLGPIVATNKDVATINFLWKVTRESLITDVGFWKNDAKYDDHGNILFQSDALVSQEGLII